MARKTPSEINPSTAERIRAKRIEKALFPEGFKLPLSGPHWNALMDFLRFYVESDHEETVWHEYHNRGTRTDDLPLVEAAANAEGLSLEEYEAREHLKQLRKFCVVNKIKLPTATPPADDGNEPPAELLANATKQIQRMIEFLWNRSKSRKSEFKMHVWNGNEPSDDAYSKAINRFREFLIEENRLDINISEKGNYIILERPS